MQQVYRHVLTFLSLQGTKGEEKEEDSKPASQQTAATPGPSEITSPGNQTLLFIEDLCSIAGSFTSK